MSESSSTIPTLVQKIPIYWRKALLSAMMTGIFIYHRRICCEDILSSHSVSIAFWSSLWVLAILWEPLTLPIGLAILHLKHDSKTKKTES